jgi:hypothetical protein
MNLRERWADWRRAPFTADSRSHVSVWTGRNRRAASEVDRHLAWVKRALAER